MRRDRLVDDARNVHRLERAGHDRDAEPGPHQGHDGENVGAPVRDPRGEFAACGDATGVVLECELDFDRRDNEILFPQVGDAHLSGARQSMIGRQRGDQRMAEHDESGQLGRIGRRRSQEADIQLTMDQRIELKRRFQLAQLNVDQRMFAVIGLDGG